MAGHLSGRQSVAVSRLPDPVEIAAYYTVSEALTNAAKHARATAVDVQVAVSDRVLHLRIRDNGRGGANFTHGTGLDIPLPLGEPGWPGPPPEAARHTRVGRQEVPKSEAQGPLSAAKSNASSKR